MNIADLRYAASWKLALSFLKFLRNSLSEDFSNIIEANKWVPRQPKLLPPITN